MLKGRYGDISVDEDIAANAFMRGQRVLFTVSYRVPRESVIMAFRNACERRNIPVRLRGSWIYQTQGSGAVLFVTEQTISNAAAGLTFDLLCGWPLSPISETEARSKIR